MSAPAWTQYLNLWIVTPTPVGDAGQKLNTNFTYIANTLNSLSTTISTIGSDYLATAGGTMSGPIRFVEDSSIGVQYYPGDNTLGNLGQRYSLTLGNDNSVASYNNLLDDGFGTTTITGDLHVAYQTLYFDNNGGSITADTAGGLLISDSFGNQLIWNVNNNGGFVITEGDLILQNGSGGQIVFADGTSQNTAAGVTPAPSLSSILTFTGTDAGGNAITDLSSIGFSDGSSLSSAYGLGGGGGTYYLNGDTLYLGYDATQATILSDGSGGIEFNGPYEPLAQLDSGGDWSCNGSGTFQNGVTSNYSAIQCFNIGGPSFSGYDTFFSSVNISAGEGGGPNSGINFSSGSSIADDGVGGIVISGSITALSDSFFVGVVSANNAISLNAGGTNNQADVLLNNSDGSSAFSFGYSQTTSQFYLSDNVSRQFFNVNYTTGATTFNYALTASTFTGSGSGLTSLNGSNVSTGTVADPRLSSNVVLKSNTNTTTPAHSTATSVAGSTTAVYTNTQFAGTTGSTAYCLNDLVTILKAAGILKS